MSLHAQLERHGPLVAAAALGVAWWGLGGPLPVFVAKELLGALLMAAAIAAGFMTTALSILLPVGSTAIGRQLRRRGKLSALFGYARSAIYACLALALVSVVGFLFFDPNTGVRHGLAVVIVAVSGYAALSLARMVEILLKVFSAMAEPEDRDG